MSSNYFNLEGKTALITGACGLLGKEHAEALLEVGAGIILTDISNKELRHTHDSLKTKYPNSSIIIHKMDVTDEANIRAVNEELNHKKVNLDILINNAAIDPKAEDLDNLSETSRLEHFSLEQWNLQINVGLTGAFLCSKVFGSKMAQEDKGGVILNIASDLSVFSPDQRLYRKDSSKESFSQLSR